MALTDKDIVITPNRGQSTDPKIDFIGASSTLGPQTISLNVYPTNSGTISFEGSAGQLFSITNSLTGTIYSVNDVSGIPSIEVLDTGLVKLAQYSGNVLVGTGTDTGHKLKVVGTTRIDGGGSQPLTISTSSGSPWAFGLIRTDTGADSKIFLHNPGSGSAWVFEHIPYFYNGGNYNVPLHNGNYNSYSPTLTGDGASGTWAISITGNAATITNQANSATITASTGINGNEIVRRSAEGYIYANHVNFNTGVENPSIANFITDNGDGWSRKSSLDHVKNSIRGVADGTWAISITGNADTVDGVHASSFLRSAGHPGYGDWNTFGNTLQTVHEIYQENFNAGSNTGSSNFPTSRSYSYGTLINFAAATARAQVYISHAGNDLIFRGGWGDSSWQTWNKVLTDQNYNSYAPTLTGDGASGTWNISITGNAATATSATDTTKLPLTGGTLSGDLQINSDWGGTYNEQFIIYGTYPSMTFRSTTSDSGWLVHTQSDGGLTYYSIAGATTNNWTQRMTLMTNGELRKGGAAGNLYIHDGNYNSYSPTLTGAGASGTWAISVTGNAATSTNASGSWQLNTDTGSKANALQYWQLSGNSTLNPTTDWHYAFRMSHGDAETYYSATIALNFFNDTLSFRRKENGTDQSWRTVLHDGNYTSYALALTGGTLTGKLIAGSSDGFSLEIRNDTAVASSSGYISFYNKNGTGTYRPAARISGINVDNAYDGDFLIETYAGGTPYKGLRVDENSNVYFYDTNGNIKFSWEAVNSRALINNNLVIHADNYNSYSPTLTGGGASGTWGISITGNSASVGGLVPAQFFNNMGNNHNTYTDFNNVPNFGAYYVQQGGNSPTGTASHQWYGFTLGLGNEYAFSSYASQLYWPRRAQNSDTYIYVRDREGGSWTGWNKIKAGYADSAGSATSASTASALTGGDSNFYALLYNANSGDLNTYNTPGLYSSEYTGGTNNPTGSTGQNGHWIQISDAGGTDVKTQWYYHNAGSDISMRLMWGGGNWKAWRKLLHDGNYNSYSPTLTGGGASGTWGINITGNAATATSATDATKLPLTGGTLTGALTTAAASGLGNGNARSLLIGYSGGNYGQIGYGIAYTGFSGAHTYAINDIVSMWEAYDGLRVYSAGAGSVGSGIIWTTVLDARRSNSSMSFKGQTVLDATNYSSYALPLSGGTISGTLTTSGAITSGTSTLTGGGQLTLNGLYGAFTIIPAATSSPTYFRGSGGGFYFQSSAAGNTTWASVDNTGLFRANSGYGSASNAYFCRAWVNFNGTGTVAIRGSANVSSITDNGTGLYTVNFTNAMPDTNYATTISASGGTAGTNYNNATSGLFSNGTGNDMGTYSTSAVQIWFTLLTNAGSGTDRATVNVAIFR